MTERRRYTRHQKATAVIAAEMATVAAAAEQAGVPESTLRDWMKAPWAVELRAKTREDLADEARVLAHEALRMIRERLPQFEPRDLAILFGVLVDKGQLLSGQPTGRVETLTGGMDDHEREALRRILDGVLEAQA